MAGDYFVRVFRGAISLGMDTCSKCDQAAKYFRRTGGDLFFACHVPKHIRTQGGLSCDWRGVGTAGGAALATAKQGAVIKKSSAA
jgi:hypothetical protein